MFDVGFSEILVLAVVALVVLGPEKLPHAARMAGAWVARIRRTVIQVQAEIESEVAASEMRERIKQELAKAKANSPVAEIEAELKAIETDIRQPDSQATVSSSTPTASAPDKP